MGSVWSSEPPPPVTLWVRVKEETDEDEDDEEEDLVNRHVKPNQRVIELLVNRRTTFFDIKQILANEFDVFPGKSPDEWCLSVSGMDGHPRMFAFAKKDSLEPDVNAYLYEAGIEDAAELVAHLRPRD